MNISYDRLSERIGDIFFEFSLLNSEINALRKRICSLENELRSYKENDIEF